MTIYFGSGYEDGTDSWTAPVNCSVVTSPVHHGTKALEVDTATGLGGTYKDLTAITEAFFQFAVRWDTNPANGTALRLGGFRYGGTNLLDVQIYNDGGTIKWRLYTRKSDFTYDTTDIAAPNPTISMWYRVEPYFKKATLNGAKLYVELTELANPAITTASTDINRIVVSTETPGGGVFPKVNWDCALLADRYIGKFDADARDYIPHAGL